MTNSSDSNNNNDNNNRTIIIIVAAGVVQEHGGSRWSATRDSPAPEPETPEESSRVMSWPLIIRFPTSITDSRNISIMTTPGLFFVFVFYIYWIVHSVDTDRKHWERKRECVTNDITEIGTLWVGVSNRLPGCPVFFHFLGFHCFPHIWVWYACIWHQWGNKTIVCVCLFFIFCFVFVYQACAQIQARGTSPV